MGAELDSMQRGSRLKELREAAGLRQKDVANHLAAINGGELSPQAVSLWEKGTVAPEIHRLRPLDELYKADGEVLQMFGLVQEMPTQLADDVRAVLNAARAAFVAIDDQSATIKALLADLRRFADEVERLRLELRELRSRLPDT